jgi:GNAT superfamily N-acetyltransferase
VRYELSDDPARVDVDAAWAFLSTQAYWGRWRTRDDFARQVAGAWRVVGCYAGDGAMVGFARAFSDAVALAYLADVYVLPAHRGAGLGRRIVRAMVEDGPGADFRWLLHTDDAHGLYAQFGFGTPDRTVMERPHVTARHPRFRPGAGPESGG